VFINKQNGVKNGGVLIKILRVEKEYSAKRLMANTEPPAQM